MTIKMKSISSFVPVKLIGGVLLVAGISFFVLQAVSVPTVLAAPSTFVVTNTNDSGAGSLRQAVTDANNNGNPSEQDTIEFNIPGVLDVDLALSSELVVSQSVLIDGYSQGNAEANQAMWPEPFNGTLRIGIDNTDSNAGIRITGDNVTLRGLVIKNAPTVELTVDHADNFRLLGSFIGIEQVGYINGKKATSTASIQIDNSNNAQIGSSYPADRNILGYCTKVCIQVKGSLSENSNNLKIQGNYIGVGIDSITPLASVNGGLGINIGQFTDNATIGGDTQGAGNTIDKNATGAIHAYDVSGLRIQGNRMMDNKGWNGFYPSEYESGGGGIFLGGVTDSIIGGDSTYARNIISGNVQGSLAIHGSSATNAVSENITVKNNWFGVTDDGTTPYPNIDSNIDVSSGSKFIHIVGNIIRNAVKEEDWQTFLSGVAIHDATNVSILGNSIYNNSSLGIDHGGNGPTANTISANSDGENRIINYPTYYDTNEAGGNTEIDYTYQAQPGTYRIEFFSNTDADSAGPGEGEKFIGYQIITKTTAGLEQFQTQVNGVGHSNLSLTATLIDATTPSGYGVTSEFGGLGDAPEPIIDLAMSVTMDSPHNVSSGSTLSYTYKLTNNGPDSLDISTLDGSLPFQNHLFIGVLSNDLSFVSNSGGNITCAGFGAGSASMFGPLMTNHGDHELVNCGYTGSGRILQAGESVSTTVQVLVTSSYNLGMSVYAIAAALSNDPDIHYMGEVSDYGQDIIDVYRSGNPQPAPNNFVWNDFNAVVDIASSGTLNNPQDVATGATLNYTYKLTNNGPDSVDISGFDGTLPGQNSIFIGILSDDLSFISNSGGDITCTGFGAGSGVLFGPVLANHSDHELVNCGYTGSGRILQAGESISTTISVLVGSSSDLNFTAYMNAFTIANDPDYTYIASAANSGGDFIDYYFAGMNAFPNNMSFNAYPVIDLNVSKVLLNPQDVAEGAHLRYEITVKNDGMLPIDLGKYDSSGSNPLASSLFVDVLPPELDFISSTSQSAVACTPAGSASVAGPILSNHSNYKLILCSYTEPYSLLPGDSVTSIIETQVNKPITQSFSNYAFNGDQDNPNDPDYTRMRWAFNTAANSNASGVDYIDYNTSEQRFSSGVNANFSTALYTYVAAGGGNGNSGSGDGSQNGSGATGAGDSRPKGLLANTGQGVSLILLLAGVGTILSGVYLSTKKDS